MQFRIADTFSISPDEHRRLKAANLVEGRYPRLIVAAQVSDVTGEKSRHIRDRGFNNRYYRDLILDLIREHQPVSREDIDNLLLDKLPDVLNTLQKADELAAEIIENVEAGLENFKEILSSFRG